MIIPTIKSIDFLLHGTSYLPYWGWHDDNRHADGTADYRPAMQQVRAEFDEFLSVLRGRLQDRPTRMLQLGLGMCEASHHVWMKCFDTVVTLDHREHWVNWRCNPGSDCHELEALSVATAVRDAYGDYDLLFIDADHTYNGVKNEHELYAPMVAKGGIIAFHDAVRREGFEEVEVHLFVNQLPYYVERIGREVGIAWYVKP